MAPPLATQLDLALSAASRTHTALGQYVNLRIADQENASHLRIALDPGHNATHDKVALTALCAGERAWVKEIKKQKAQQCWASYRLPELGAKAPARIGFHTLAA
jgi:hypothetical protein